MEPEHIVVSVFIPPYIGMENVLNRLMDELQTVCKDSTLLTNKRIVVMGVIGTAITAIDSLKYAFAPPGGIIVYAHDDGTGTIILPPRGNPTFAFIYRCDNKRLEL